VGSVNILQFEESRCKLEFIYEPPNSRTFEITKFCYLLIPERTIVDVSNVKKEARS